MAGLDIRAVGPGADLQRMNNRVLLKMALERKGYQQARKEVLAEDVAGFSSAAPGDSVEVDAVEFQSTRIEIDVQGQNATVSVLRVDARALHVGVAAHAAAPPQPQPKDPLLLDLRGEGPATSGANGARTFDLAGDGHAAPTSFVTGDSAFLALDRNGNGQIDSGLELFGDQHGATDGFAELARFDANGDGRIDAQDPVFNRLQLLYGDGHRSGLAESGIAAIDLASTSGYALSNGDAVLRQGAAYRGDGSKVGAYAMGLQQFEAQA